MKCIYFRELKNYALSEITNSFGLDDRTSVRIVDRLQKCGVLKRVCRERQDLSDICEDQEVYSEAESGGNDIYYVFRFVGVLILETVVIKVYPKYIQSSRNLVHEFRQIISVLIKQSSSSELIRSYSSEDDDAPFSILSAMLFLLRDYWENGLYSNTERIIADNGPGEINWDRTINESAAYIHNRRPVYCDLKTYETKVDDYDFFKRLHACILTEISNELRLNDDADDISLLDLFGIEGVDLSSDTREALGDDSYLLYRLEKELSRQFNSRKQFILSNLYSYISHDCHLSSPDNFSIFGTNSFHVVWENICRAVFKSDLGTRLGDLGFPEIKRPYKTGTQLIHLISLPRWHETETHTSAESKETLRPDIIKIDCESRSFIILDAKYYVPVFKNGHEPYGMPGIADLTKQYLYEYAYHDFIKKHQLSNVFNCFIMPDQEWHDDPLDKCSVRLGFFKGTVRDIHIIMVSAPFLYEKYLSGESLRILISNKKFQWQ